MVEILTTEGKTISNELDQDKKAEKVLKEIGINPETVLIKRDGEIVTRKDKVSNQDKLELIRVVSGG